MLVDFDKLDGEARAILTGNDQGGYTVPTEGLYPFQWNWDSCFAAWGFSSFDVKRAWFEIQTLFMGQWDNGLLPHIVFHKEAKGYFPSPDDWGVGRATTPTSGITQPPIAATMIRSIYEADKAYGRAYIELYFSRLLAWHRWFVKYRLEKGMIAITHPWEGGRDNAVDWDGPMQAVDTSGVGDYKRRDTSCVDADQRPQKPEYDRYLAMLYYSRETGWDEEAIAKGSPFRVADPGMSLIFLRACRDLLALAKEIGKPVDEIEGWIAVLEAGAKNHWNPKGFYDSVDLRKGSFTDSLTSASFLCWYAGIENADMLAHLEATLEKVRYGVPSLYPDDPRFEPQRYWRGPVWGVVNTLIGLGLEECGHSGLAERLRRDTRTLIAEHGFYEYFSPLDGAPAGGGTFTWTAAIWLAWAGPNAKGRL